MANGFIDDELYKELNLENNDWIINEEFCRELFDINFENNDWIINDNNLENLNAIINEDIYNQSCDTNLEIGENSIQEPRQEEEKLKCGKCDKKFSSISNKKRHEKKCKGKKIIQCHHCQIICNTDKDLNDHKFKEHPKEQGLQCSKCNKVFQRTHHRKRHEVSCEGNNFRCRRCQSEFTTIQELKQHQNVQHPQPKRKGSENDHPSKKQKTDQPATSSSSEEPSKKRQRIGCETCEQLCENGQFVQYHAHFRNQHGGEADLQEEPWQENPFDNDEMEDTYNDHRSDILANHNTNRLIHTYNFPTNHLEGGIQEFSNHLNTIYDQENSAFRVNLAFGMILRHVETGEYRYFVPYYNETLFENPIVVSRRANLRHIFLRLKKLDIENYMKRTRPDTKWKPVMITNINYYVYPLNYTLGKGHLPTYIRNCPAIIALDAYNTGKPYKDNLCFFRCLVKFYNQKLCKENIQTYYQQWCRYANMETPMKNFPGIELYDIPDVEKCFKLNINIFDRQPDTTVTPLHKSDHNYQQTIYLNMYENHLSYVKNFKSYAKKFHCPKCDRHFNHLGLIKRHLRVCSNVTKLKYPGGFFEKSKSIFDQLEAIGITVPKKDQVYPWFINFDFEAMLHKINEQPSEKLKWIEKHIPISVSLCSNVPGFTDPKWIVNSDLDEMLSEMILHMTEISNKANTMAKAKWYDALEELEVLNKEYNNGEEEEDKGNGKKTMKKIIEELYTNFSLYCKQIPIASYNGSRYDINLIKSKLAKHLDMDTAKHTFTVKKNNAYMCIANENFKFIDICQYLAPGSSYSKFLAAFKVEEKKSYFPYQWFDSTDKLDYPELPAYETFHSDLKGGNVLALELQNWDKKGQRPKTGQENYDDLKQIWEAHHMKSFRDFLEYYNNLDVGPMVTAIERLQKFYFDHNIDLFKISISVPGVARKILFDSAECHFALFDKKNEDLFKTIKQNIIGGPSIIFNRHHKAGETFIRNGKLCRNIVGYDANALYLWAIGQAMPSGCFVRRLLENGFKPKLSTKFLNMYIWMDFIADQQNINILHKINNGKEHRIGPYFVDGYCRQTNTVYEYNGCYHHGHQCDLTRHITNEKEQKKQEEKLKKTKERQQFLESQGYKVVFVRECEFLSNIQSKTKHIRDRYLPQFYQKHKYKISQQTIVNAVKNDSLFGMVEVDIEVPDYLKDYFSEMSPIFCTTEVPYDVIGEHMQQHVKDNKLSDDPRKLLVGGMAGKKILIATPLLKWYLEHGLQITKIHQVIEFTSNTCFKDFQNKVSEARREGDRNPSTAIIAETMKLIGNSGYGSMIMDKEKHQTVNYLRGEKSFKLAVNNPKFKKACELDEDFYEVESGKNQISLNLPIQLGYFILQYAKLRMLQFYYDCIDKYIDRCDFEYCEMDTDSAYFAISADSLEDIIKPELRSEFDSKLKKFCAVDRIEANTQFWFPRECCKIHKAYDRREPGLFKLEAEGEEIIALCSKTYVLKQGEKCKLTCKGINKNSVTDPLPIFRQVLENKTTHSAPEPNRGFRARENTMFTYTQSRNGFAYFYCKREVCEDGVNTKPLEMVLSPWTDYNVLPVNSKNALSNSYYHPLIIDGKSFQCIDQAFAYEKAIHHNKILLAQNVLESDERPLKLVKDIKLNDSWYDRRNDVMSKMLRIKFETCEQFRSDLQSSGNKLLVYVENYDKFWGCGFNETMVKLTDPKKYPGQNQLGLLLMELRK